MDECEHQDEGVICPRGKEFANDELILIHRQGHQYFKRALAVLFRNQAHGEQRTHQEHQEGEQLDAPQNGHEGVLLSSPKLLGLDVRLCGEDQRVGEL